MLVVVRARGQRRLAGAVRVGLGRQRAARAQAGDEHRDAAGEQHERPPEERVVAAVADDEDEQHEVDARPGRPGPGERSSAPKATSPKPAPSSTTSQMHGQRRSPSSEKRRRPPIAAIARPAGVDQHLGVAARRLAQRQRSTSTSTAA